MVRRVEDCLRDFAWEIIFVDDDSPDGTADLVRQLGAKDARIRCVQRIDRRGLSSASVEGMLASSAPYLAVIDGDLQHDERLLPQMLADLRAGGVDMVVGTRYSLGGGTGDWNSARV